MEKIILFQGDSITDVGRSEKDTNYLGNGYPSIIANKFKGENNPDIIINRAIGGDRTFELLNRWNEDCLKIKPDILSLLVGINDCWWQYDGEAGHTGTPLDVFQSNYDSLLSQVVSRKNDTVFILMEPYVLPFPEDRKNWRVTLDPYIHAVRGFAKKYHAHLVPLDDIMNAAAIEYGCEAICNAADGVHPTPLGQQIIADAWLKEYRKLN